MPVKNLRKVCCISILSFTTLTITNTILAQDEPPKQPSSNAKDLLVKITQSLPFLDVFHNGKPIRIQRIQDIDYKVTNSFSKTSRQCPPFCIHPIKLKLPGNIKTVGELELLDFLQNKVSKDTGLLIDARLSEWYKKGTIPASISIPFTMFVGGVEDSGANNLLQLLGVQENDEDDDERLFENAIDLMLFSNGPWSGQAPKAIQHLLHMGYPAEKISWYRGGMQAWSSFGLTTIKP
jgi:rhodanese-related sulfurtransferase